MQNEEVGEQLRCLRREALESKVAIEHFTHSTHGVDIFYLISFYFIRKGSLS